MSGVKHMRIGDIPAKRTAIHEKYEYVRRKFVAMGEAEHTQVGIYEVPPGKAAYPYHCHFKNEETFYILSGEGLLKTPEGERTVSAGDLLFFPAGPEGAHKLTCTGDAPLVYIDFDVTHDLDACLYPDSGKIGVWGKNINRLYPYDEHVDYYEGE